MKHQGIKALITFVVDTEVENKDYQYQHLITSQKQEKAEERIRTSNYKSSIGFH